MWPAIAAAAIGAAGSYLASDNNNKAVSEANAQSNIPKWAPEQLPYTFQGSGWNPAMPGVNAGALNYGLGLTGGFNPGTGPQQPMEFNSLLSGLLGGYDNAGVANPWYQDPRSTTQLQEGQGSIGGLLGYGAGTPPPLMTSNPYYSGQGVVNPEQMMAGPGMHNAPQYQPTAAAPAPAPTQNIDFAAQMAAYEEEQRRERQRQARAAFAEPSLNDWIGS